MLAVNSREDLYNSLQQYLEMFCCLVCPQDYHRLLRTLCAVAEYHFAGVIDPAIKTAVLADTSLETSALALAMLACQQLECAETNHDRAATAQAKQELDLAFERLPINMAHLTALAEASMEGAKESGDTAMVAEAEGDRKELQLLKLAQSTIKAAERKGDRLIDT